LRIKDALPELFQRAYPALDPKMEMLSALSLLQFHGIDALPLSFDSDRKNRAVTGFSSLARVMRLDRKGLPTFLRQPCEEASEPLSTVGAERSVSVLLDKFLRTRFGFARVEEKKNVGALVSLWDLLGLYQTRVFNTDLTVEDVGSSIFSMPPRTTAREALRAMFRRGVRRVFVDSPTKFVWDRGMIERLFSPSVLASAAENPSGDLLEITLSELEPVAAGQVKPGTKLREAARMLRQERRHCLVFDRRVVTPWDVVMKPWKAKALKIG